jgi:hypothetical protein
MYMIFSPVRTKPREKSGSKVFTREISSSSPYAARKSALPFEKRQKVGSSQGRFSARIRLSPRVKSA